MQIDNEILGDAAIIGGLVASNLLLYRLGSYIQEEADRKARLERAYDVLGRYDPSALGLAERLLQRINVEKTSGRYLQ